MEILSSLLSGVYPVRGMLFECPGPPSSDGGGRRPFIFRDTLAALETEKEEERDPLVGSQAISLLSQSLLQLNQKYQRTKFSVLHGPAPNFTPRLSQFIPSLPKWSLSQAVGPLSGR